MPTLFDQPVRTRYTQNFDAVSNFLEKALNISDKYQVPLHDVLYAAEVLEMKRRNEIMLDDFDAKDEQLAGFGEILQTISNHG